MDYTTGKELERVNERLDFLESVLINAKLIKIQKKEEKVENQKQKIM